MASQAVIRWLLLVQAVLLLCICAPGGAQSTADCDTTEQPVISGIDPPSGPGGLEYTLTGELLDQVQDVTVIQDGNPLTISMQSGSETTLQFTIVRPDNGPATVALTPFNPSCATPTIVIELRSFGVAVDSINGLASGNRAQPGTVMLVGGCFPDDCGDNSSLYSVYVGEVMLQQLSDVQSARFIARFPEVQSPFTGALAIVSQYTTFQLGINIEVNLTGTITTVVPSSGQRRTRVTITGTNLLGLGTQITISEVQLGGNTAEIISDSNSEIVVRAISGTAGIGSIMINTTQSNSEGMFAGPYTFTADGWTQLEDGVVTDVVPPAAQAGRAVSLCGERLLGGGASITMVELAGEVSTVFSSVPFTSGSNFPGDKCINAIVPTVVVPEGGNTGPVILTADTEAVVESQQDVMFSFAEIASVTPDQGLVGTRVTITGTELLSGYSVPPRVYLAGVEASVISSGSNEIVVRAEMPPEPEPEIGSGQSGESGQFGQSGSGMMESERTTGNVEIVVTSPDVFALDFTVSIEEAWTYAPPGEITNVIPRFGQYGTRINIIGTNLLGLGTSLTHVTVNGTNATIIEAGNELVVIVAPDLDGVGFVTIILFSNTGAEIGGAGLFEYRRRGEIETVTPTDGQSGTYVTIMGTNLFGHGNTVDSVTFGVISAAIDFSQTDETSIRVRIQPNDNTVDTAVPIRIVADTSAIVASDGDIWTYLVPGTVDMVSPSQGQEGTRVTITGSNLLGGGTTLDSIFLDGVPAEFDTANATNTEIRVQMVGIDQQTDMFRGEVYIMADTGAIVTGGTYTHSASGQITSFSPMQGREGTLITLTGNNLLGFGTNITRIEVEDVEGTFENFDGNVVTVRVGAASEGTVGPITLEINTGAVVSSGQIMFTYERPGSIMAVEPDQGTEGSGILIIGDALRISGTTITSITLGGSPVSRIVTDTETEISVIIGPAPIDNPDRAEIVITASDGSFVSGAFFSYENLTISLPDRTQGQEGTIVRINLPPSFEPSLNLRASVDDQEATIINVNVAERYIEISVPRARRPGTYSADVAVENTNRAVARLRDGFTYLPEGVIFSITPNEGQQGTRVRVQGENLLGGGAEVASAVITSETLTNPPISADVLFSNNTVVELVISGNPPQGMGPTLGDLILTADTGAVVRRLGGFILVEPGRITSVTPTFGQDGTQVTIIGTDLLQSMPVSSIESVTLSGQDAIILTQEDGFSDPDDSQITVQAESSTAGMGPVEITLITGALITSADAGITFEYIEEGMIDDVNPMIGTVGTRVEIRGTNLLGGGTNLSVVYLAGVSASIVEVSDMTVSVVAQNATPSMGSVMLVSNTGAIVQAADQWVYEELGNITGIDPIFGQQGEVVNISGISLLGSSASEITTCTLAGIPAEVVESADIYVLCRAGFNPDSERLPPGNLGGLVVLTADSGPEIISTEIFSYYVAYILRIDPTEGTNGTFVSIAGMNLFGVPNSNFTVDRVEFGGTAATEITVLSENDLIVRVGESVISSLNNTVRVVSTSGAFLELESAWNYTEPGEIQSIFPDTGAPGQTITITGENLVPPCIPDVRVILGQTESFNATIVNTSTVEFRPGVYQENPTQNLDNPDEEIPLQIIAGNGATVFSDTIQFSYNATGIVTSIFPGAGGNGSEVTIRGSNLLNNGTPIRVTLAGIEAYVANYSETEVNVTAGLGPVEGIVGGVVIEADNGLLSGLAGDVWTYLPVITSNEVSPLTGQNGTNVEIDLSSIPEQYTLVAVYLTGVEAEILSETNGVVAIEAGPSNQTSLGDITLRFNDSIFLTIPDAWSYQPPVEISSVTPTNGYFRTSVNITGSNFQAGGVEVSSVYLAGVRTDIDFQSDTELRVRISQTVDSSSGDIEESIVIRSENEATHTSATNFTYVQVRIDSVDPQFGQEGTQVRIQGVGLRAGGDEVEELFIGEREAMITLENDSVILVSAAASPNATDLLDITYTVDTDATVEIPDTWSYIVPGEITGVSPSSGTNGTVVTINGRGLFGGGERAEMVLFDTIAVSEILVSDDSLIQVRLGPSTTPISDVVISVTANTGAVTRSDPAQVSFQYLLPGAVTAFDPQEGQNGTRVTINGTRLHYGEGIRRVLLAGVEAVIEEIGDSLPDSVVTVRAGRPSVLGPFSGPVTVESESGAITESTTEFCYTAEGLILSVIPAQGRGGAMVRIEGERLLGGGSMLDSVYLAGVEATIPDLSGTSTSVTIVASDPGNSNETTGDLVLVSDSGAYVRRIAGWTYVQEGTITSVMPPEGQFGTRITISGERLLSGGTSIEQVFIGDVPVYSVESSSENTVIVRAGEPENGEAFNTTNITLISNFGGRLEMDFAWSYLNQSVIESISPINGSGNVTVVVNGVNLLGGGTIISSVTVAEIEVRDIPDDDNDTVVVFVTGLNPTGEQIEGRIILESDTGARTVSEGNWTYERECPEGFFGNVDNCSSCNPECMNCFGPENTECFNCNNFRIVLSDTTMQCVSRCPNVSTLSRECVDACDSNQYQRINTTEGVVFCYDCDTLCDPNRGCSGPSPTECGACANFYNTLNGSCVEQCPVGTFSNETNDCRPCDDQCVLEDGCRGPNACDCVTCRNVQVRAVFMDSTSIEDICIENCSSGFYEDSQRFCQPCADECVGCTGPTVFDCISCRAFAIQCPNGTEKCVPTCNPTPNMLTMYDDTSGVCKPCNPRCSLTGGCVGPTAFDCNGCRVNQTSNDSLPMANGECVLTCTNFTYSDSTIGQCVSCNPSCDPVLGCTGPEVEDCRREGDEGGESQEGAFDAGSATIAIVVVIIVALFLIILVILVIFLVWRFAKGRKYKLGTGRDGSVEMAERYSHIPQTSETKFQKTPEKIKKPTGVTNEAFEGDLYTEMSGEERVVAQTKAAKPGPVVRVEELYTDVEKQQSAAAKTAPVRASQELYTDMEPAPLERELKKDPSPVTPLAPIIPPKPGQSKPPPSPPQEDPPSSSKRPPPRPPSPEMYTDMHASVHEVYINPVADEEYSEMSPTSIEREDFYDEATSLQQPSKSKLPSVEEKVPLLTSEPDYIVPPPPTGTDALYEDTDVAAAAAVEYKRTSLPLPPDLPQRPPPRKRSSEPLPLTPLEKSLTIPTGPGRTAPPQTQEVLYEETGLGLPIEESLYESIPGGRGERLISDPPSPSPPTGRKPRKGKSDNPLPLPPKPTSRKK